MSITRRGLFLLGALALLPLSAQANERRFTYTYETATLPPGARELEVWSTARIKREELYSRFDNRLEFEWGLTEKLMTAVYLNTSAISARDPSTGGIATGYEFGGVSSEWKYKLKDPVADAFNATCEGSLYQNGFYGDGIVDALRVLSARR